MTGISRQPVSSTDHFFELASSWPLGDPEFDTLCRLVGMVPPDTLQGRLQVVVETAGDSGIAERDFHTEQLRGLAAAGYIDVRFPGDGSTQIDLAPLMAAIGLCLVIIAKSGNRAWIVFKRFPDEPIAILDVTHALADGKPIALLTRGYWQNIEDRIVERNWNIPQLIDRLRRDTVERLGMAAE